ncbi:MAG: zinc ribbon domain-containing protein [Planctomycetota bacterium]|nr:zinc ribbon domain-containing protein [Planctomycetota bacterium]
MLICRKCNKQVDVSGKICRACGSILEEVPDGQALDVGGPVATAAPPGTGSLPDAELPEEEASFEQELARPPWKCPTCGETVPGNFDLC